MVARGSVFWLELELEGRTPVCVLTRDAAIPTLANIVVALITTRIRGIPSEVSLGPARIVTALGYGHGRSPAGWMP